MRRALLPPTDRDLAQSMINLAIVILELGMMNEAETLLLDAKKILSAYGEEEEQCLAICLLKLADIRRTQGRLDDARDLHFEVGKIKQRSPYQAFDPRLAGLLLDQAIIACDLNDFTTASNNLTRAEEIVLMVLGENHSDYARCLTLRGMIHLGQKRKRGCLSPF